MCVCAIELPDMSLISPSRAKHHAYLAPESFQREAVSQVKSSSLHLRLAAAAESPAVALRVCPSSHYHCAKARAPKTFFPHHRRRSERCSRRQDKDSSLEQSILLGRTRTDGHGLTFKHQPPGIRECPCFERSNSGPFSGGEQIRSGDGLTRACILLVDVLAKGDRYFDFYIHTISLIWGVFRSAFE